MLKRAARKAYGATFGLGTYSAFAAGQRINHEKL
jgi:hypothetical protein